MANIAAGTGTSRAYKYDEGKADTQGEISMQETSDVSGVLDGARLQDFLNANLRHKGSTVSSPRLGTS